MLWRTLTGSGAGEWSYLFNERANAASKYGWACVNGINGILILPDSWTQPSGVLFVPSTVNYYTNTYTTSQWALMENNGAVFLPAAGIRRFHDVSGVDSEGWYWSSWHHFEGATHYLGFDGSFLNPFDFYAKSVGLSVRLVQDL